MLQVEARSLREEAAKKTRLRIAADLQRASKAVAPLLKYIDAHLFETGLRYQRMRRACGIRDNNRSTVFRQEVGLTPAAYIRDCRLEVACRLLRGTDLDVAEVGALVGYTVPNVFGAAFRQWAGITPRAYRREERETGGHDLPLPEDLPEITPASWRRFAEGQLPDEEADLLMRHFLGLYPASRRRLMREVLRQVQLDDRDAGAPEEQTALPSSLRSLFAREDIEHLMAEVVWEEICDKPWPELDDLVRHHLRFTTRAFFDFLGEKYIEESRKERARGVEIARLALAAADAIEGDGAEVGGRGPMKALAWGWLGNAKRLAHDFVGADEAFRAAQHHLPEEADLETGVVFSMLAMLRRWQRRHEEALVAANEAIPRLEAVGESDSLARTYVVRGIVQRVLGDLDAAARDNEAAAGLLDPQRDERLFFSTRYNHANCLVRAARPEAAEAISAARQLVGDDVERAKYVTWLEGLLAAAEGDWRSALAKLVKAREGFREREETAVVAVLTLDLAIVALQAGDPREARDRTEEALPLFEALAFGDETLAARLIREDAREVTERIAEVLSGGMTSRAVHALQGAACILGAYRGF